MIGAAAAGQIQDMRGIGRRWTFAIGGALSIVAVATCYVADTASNIQAAFFGGKLLEGVAVGVTICATQTYLSEVVPQRLRGPVLALFPTLQLVGQLVAAGVVLSQNGVENKTSYRTALASEWPFSAIPLILAIFIPESPVYLLSKNQTSSARDSFRKLHGAQAASEHQNLFEDMHKVVEEERRAAHDRSVNYIECFRGSNTRRTLIVIFANVIPELFGLSLLGHVTYFLPLLGLSRDVAFILLIVGVLLGLVSNIGSFWTLLKFGRRILILISLGAISVVWLSIGIAGCFKGTTVAWYAAIAFMLIIVVAGLSAWPASYVVSSETSSLRLRSKTSGLGWLIGGIIRCGFDVGSPYLYNSDAGDLGAKTGFVFCGTAAVGVVITWFTLPEMKGLNSAEIDHLFEQKRSVRRVNTSQFERVGSGDDLPLRNMDSESTEYDAASVDSSSIGPVISTESYHPLRKRPTF